MSVYVVMRQDKLFFHFGIMFGTEQVIHFASKTNNMFAQDQTVKMDNLEQFSKNRPTKVLYKVDNVLEREIIERAMTYVGKNEKYSLFSNNCISFILWCTVNKKKSCFINIFSYYVKYVIKGLLV